MNRDLYTDEFRHFKYLKSFPEAVAFFKETSQRINIVQPWAEKNDPNFIWPCRVEFLEQLLDLENDTVYLVHPGTFHMNGSTGYEYEDARIYEIVNPVIYESLVIKPKEGRKVTFEDIPKIEDELTKGDFVLCSNVSDEFDIRTSELPIIPTKSNNMSFSALFYDKAVAEKYKIDVKEYLSRWFGAISAITTHF